MRANSWLVVAFALHALSAFAEEPPPPSPAPVVPRDPAVSREQFEELEQKVLILERNLELQREQAREAQKKGATVTAAPGRGFSVTTNDNKFALAVRARVQIRDTMVWDQKDYTNEINVKTLRLVLGGHVLTPDLKYALQLAFGANDFELGNLSPIFDAFVDYVRLRDLNIRVGQYFVPFDRARTIREFALQMVDRQQVVQEFTLDRDVGLTLYSNDLFGTRILGYALFVGGGEGKNRFGGQRPGGLYIGRIVLRPWGPFDDDIEGDLSRSPRPRLAIGVAGGYNDNTNRARSTTGAINTLGVFDYGHAAVDVVFKHWGFSLLAEGVARLATRDFRDGTGANLMPLREWSRSGAGYFVQAGMMVHPLVEVAARWEQIFAIGDTDPALKKTVAEQGKQVGAGLNLYLNGHLFKIQTDLFYIFGDDAAAGRVVARLQLDGTF